MGDSVVIELKPCAFCRGTKISAHEGSTHRWAYLACNSCGGTKGDCRKVDIALPAEHPINMEALAADWNDREPAEESTLPALLARALEALEAAQKHHGATSMALAIERFGSVEAVGEFGRKTWRELVPNAIAGLKSATAAAPDQSAVIVDKDGNFNTKDPQLSLLLSLAGDIAKGEAKMDTGIWFVDTLDAVEKRLLPAGDAAEVVKIVRDSDEALRYCIQHFGADFPGLQFRLGKAVADLGGAGAKMGPDGNKN